MDVSNSINILNIVNLVIIIFSLIGGFMAIKSSLSKTASEIQDRVINAMEKEVDVLRGQITTLEDRNNRLDQVISTICEALKKRGLNIAIEGNTVTISDRDGKDTVSSRIQGS